MGKQSFIRRCQMGVSAQDAFRWHEQPGAFERLNPASGGAGVLERSGGIDHGKVLLRVPFGPFGVRWQLEHCDYIFGRQFCDVQIRGPFSEWRHTHRFEPQGPSASTLEDRIDYALPLGALGAIADGMVRQRLERLFDFRHRAMLADLDLFNRYKKADRMKVLVSGSTGLVGSALVPLLSSQGLSVVRLARSSAPGSSAISWDPAAGRLDPVALEGIDAVVHLAGENVASGRWNAKRKLRILDSRVQGTRLLSETIARLERPPKTLVCASAVGYYGDRGQELLDEQSPPGGDFLSDVCHHWEAAAEPARQAGIRVVHCRFGVVLSAAGGALKKMLPPFRMGLGGRLGSGRQYMSWIALDDAIGAIYHALMTDSLAGPVNAATPEAVTNLEFTKVLGRVLSRPTIFPVPAAALRLLLGQMADEMLLSSIRVRPARLLESGYKFREPDLEPALRHMLGKT